MTEANYQTWMKTHQTQVARIEADLAAIRLVTRTQPVPEAVKAGRTAASSDTAPGTQKPFLLRRLASRICGRGSPQP